MKKNLRLKIHARIRRKILGTSSRPRLAVYRSNSHIFAQIIDDTISKTLVAASDLKAAKEQKNQKAYKVGKELAAEALKLKIKKVVFDRGGFLYHGRIESLAKGAREGGLDF